MRNTLWAKVILFVSLLLLAIRETGGKNGASTQHPLNTSVQVFTSFLLSLSLSLSGVLKQSEQWTFFSPRSPHGPYAAGAQIPSAVTGMFVQVCVCVCGCINPCMFNFHSKSIFFVCLCLQELVKHTTDPGDKENLRTALDAMRVSLYQCVHISQNLNLWYLNIH